MFLYSFFLVDTVQPNICVFGSPEKLAKNSYDAIVLAGRYGTLSTMMLYLV